MAIQASCVETSSAHSVGGFCVIILLKKYRISSHDRSVIVDSKANRTQSAGNAREALERSHYT